MKAELIESLNNEINLLMLVTKQVESAIVLSVSQGLREKEKEKEQEQENGKEKSMEEGKEEEVEKGVENGNEEGKREREEEEIKKREVDVDSTHVINNENSENINNNNGDEIIDNIDNTNHCGLSSVSTERAHLDTDCTSSSSILQTEVVAEVEKEVVTEMEMEIEIDNIFPIADYVNFVGDENVLSDVRTDIVSTGEEKVIFTSDETIDECTAVQIEFTHIDSLNIDNDIDNNNDDNNNNNNNSIGD